MLPTIAQHAKSHGLEPLKKLGQNFLFDLSLCEKIANCNSYIQGNIIIEIGPGPGGLTRAILLAKPQYLVVIEQDKRCIALLKEIKTFYPNLLIIEGDALKLTINDIITHFPLLIKEMEICKLHIISNVPYNITTPLLFHWFKEISFFSSINIMIQKEVADRICSKKDNKLYGRLSIICQLLCDVSKRFDVAPMAFYPPPKVHSTVISLIPKLENLTLVEVNYLEILTHHAFSMRRKMLKSSLKIAISDIQEFLNDLKINPSLRAENLSPMQYLLMARKLISDNKVGNINENNK